MSNTLSTLAAASVKLETGVAAGNVHSPRFRLSACGLVAMSLLLHGLCTTAALADKVSGTDALRSFLQQTHSAHGTFIQIVHQAAGGRATQWQGRFMFKRPGRFQWLIDQPYEQAIYSDGKTLQVYDKALNQLSLRPLQTSASAAQAAHTATPADLLFGTTTSGRDPLASWTLQAIDPPKGQDGAAQPGDADLAWVRLVPRPVASANPAATSVEAFQNVQLGLKGNLPQRLNFQDALGQQTALTLTWQTQGAVPDDAQFKFTPPAGVEVIDLLKPGATQ